MPKVVTLILGTDRSIGSRSERLDKIISQVERMKEITGKLMGITRYETVEYLNGSKIVDIDRSSAR